MNTAGSKIMIWGIDDQVLESHLLAQTNSIGIEVRRRCADAVELLAAASISPGIPVLVSAQLPRISSEVLGKIAEGGRSVTVIAHSQQQQQMIQAWNIGAVHRVDYPFLGAPDVDLAQLMRSDAPHGEGSPIVKQVDQEPAIRSGLLGQVVSMWSPMGSTGRSTLALGLAEAWASAGERVLLIDADTYAPSLGTALGISDEISGLVVACRYADHNALDERTLSSACREIEKNLWILTGLSDPARWPEIQPQSLTRVIATSREYFDRIVVDISAVMPDYVDPIIDPASRLTPVRNGAGIAVLAAADLVAVVIRPDAVGAARLVQDFGRHAHYFAQAQSLFLLNRIKGSRIGSTIEDFERICSALGASSNSVIAPIPEDDIAHTMLQSAATMREVGPRSDLYRSLHRLVSELGRRQNNNEVADFRPLIKFFSVFGRHAYATAGSNG